MMLNTVSSNANREFSFDDKDFRFLAKLANERTGIVLADNKRDMVYGRLARRLRVLKLDNFSDYCSLLQSDSTGEELGQMVNAITTNLTSFFRESHHFDHLREVMEQRTKDMPSDKHLRIWSSACSSGMEPYSIAMTLKSAIRDITSWNAKILATDIDSNMVATGSKGEYAASDLEDAPSAYKNYTEQGSSVGKLRMKDDLRQLVAFRQLNLLDSWPMKGKFDIIFCRNVVIYFDKATKQQLFARMAECLNPNGWLYIGHSENLHGISDRFELIGRTIYRKVK